MRKKTNNLIFPLIMVGLFLIFASSCDDKGLPALSTTEITDITQTTAKSGGNITSDGSETVMASGVCWSLNQNPTISDNKTTDGTLIGEFSSTLTVLSPNTTYYVRSYATNRNGTAYGSVKSFKTLQVPSFSSFMDIRDGTIYKTVTIGNQIWMAENLKYLPIVEGPLTYSQTTPTNYVYGYEGTDVNAAKTTVNYSTYGVLYNWPAAMAGLTSSTVNPSGVQGICPTGWHLPSDAEWTELCDYLGGRNVAGGKLKETGTSHWDSPNTGATNECGFTALPGGIKGTGFFHGIGYIGGWWSTTDNEIGYIDFRYMQSDYSVVFKTNCLKDVGLSVRCLKN